MSPRRDVACAIHGLVACVACAVLGFSEIAHHHQHETGPAIEMALPPELDDTHRDYERSIRFEASAITASGTSSRRAGTRLGPHGLPMGDYGDFSGKRVEST